MAHMSQKLVSKKEESNASQTAGRGQLFFRFRCQALQRKDMLLTEAISRRVDPVSIADEARPGVVFHHLIPGKDLLVTVFPPDKLGIDEKRS